MELGKMFKRFPTLFPPIFKDCSYRLITNKLTWVLVAILMLPCALGLLVYYEFSGDRISEEVNGEKIYYTSSGELLHEDLRVLFLERESNKSAELPPLAANLRPTVSLKLCLIVLVIYRSLSKMFGNLAKVFIEEIFW